MAGYKKTDVQKAHPVFFKVAPAASGEGMLTAGKPNPSLSALKEKMQVLACIFFLYPVRRTKRGAIAFQIFGDVIKKKG